MIKVTDTHAHYDDEAFDSDRDILIPTLFEKKAENIVTIGSSIESSVKAAALAAKYPRMYAAAGVHPEFCTDLPEDYLVRIRELAALPKVKAIGEIGLDYHYEGYNREMQIRVFEEQLELAASLSMPVVIHSRDASADTMELLRKYRPKAVLHCYSGSPETAAEIISMGMYISFTGVLTFKNAKKAVNVCKMIPEDRLMLETDCPYMAPEPFRGKRCDSSMVYYTALKAAEIRGVDIEELIMKCNQNACRFFGMD